MNIKNILLSVTLLVLMLSVISCVSAADDNSQVVCENCNDNISLGVEVNADSKINTTATYNDDLIINNTHDKIVIENVEKNGVIISNSSSLL